MERAAMSMADRDVLFWLMVKMLAVGATANVHVLTQLRALTDGRI